MAVPLLDRRLLFVTGKGGVGRTTVAAALGLLAARRGRRTIVCEVGGHESLARALKAEDAGHEETEVAPGLWAISIDPDRAFEQYLTYQAGSRTLSRLLSASRIFALFRAAAPGSAELLSIGKAWELAQPERRYGGHEEIYDLVIVDAPATGHGVALLAAPATFRTVAAAGPIHRQAGIIEEFLSDPGRTAVVTVAAPEEMPVTEALEGRDMLAERAGVAVDAFVANGLYPQRLSAAEAKRLEARAAKAPDGALAAALELEAAARSQRGQLRRLRRGAGGAPVLSLPYLFDGATGLERAERLADALGRRL